MPLWHDGNNYIGNVNLLTTGGNPYESMREVLAKLGIKTTGQSSFEGQFGIAVRPPTKLPTPITSTPHKLVTETIVRPVLQSQQPGADYLQQSAMHDLVMQAQSELGFEPGGFNMLTLDIPDLPYQTSNVVLVAQANQKTSGGTKAEHVMGVCYVVANVPEDITHYDAGDFPSQTLVYPYEAVSAYFSEFQHRDINIYYGNVGTIDKSTSVIVQQPKRGILVHTGRGDYDAYYYKPDAGYFGKDSAVIQAEVNGHKVKIQYYFHSLDTRTYQQSEVCGKKGWIWKISLADTPLHSASIQSLLSFTGTNVPVTIEMTELAGNEVGSVQGATINLDTNAAGHGWFVDSTPGDNEEFLPTSNPNVWVAKAGSAAEDKMDMLSVLMHEYGHVLGLEHSTAANDVMAAVLQPGVRKLWSESDLAKLNEAIVASLPDQNDQPVDRQSDGLPPAGQQRTTTQLGRARRLPGSGTDPESNTGNNAQALHAINATLTNGTFQIADSWETTGAVKLANGQATLSEAAGQQSQLSQGFVLSAEDRFLTFTVDGLQLTDSTNGPDDAFEVALLNANTRGAATSTVNLSRTDALLNIQANGTEHRIDGLRRIDNADGSRTYVLDLVARGQPLGIGAGEGVALSFDLIGFGAADSRVSISSARPGARRFRRSWRSPPAPRSRYYLICWAAENWAGPSA